MRNTTPFFLALPVAVALALTGCIMPSPRSSYQEIESPKVQIKAKPDVVMPILEKEVTAVYAGCEITKVSPDRLRVVTAKPQAGNIGYTYGGGSTVYNLRPTPDGGTEVSAELIAITPQGVMKLPWFEESAKRFLQTGIFDRTKQQAETAIN